MLCFALLCFALGTNVARASLIDFEDVFSHTDPISNHFIVGEYRGLLWDNEAVGNLAHSGNYAVAALHGIGIYYPYGSTNNPPYYFGPSGTFDLTSLWVSAPYNDNFNIEVRGYLAGNLVYSYDVLSDTIRDYTLLTLNFNHIDVFNIIGRDLDPLADPRSKTWVAIDDVTVDNIKPDPLPTAVPEPATLWLFSAGIGLLGLGNRNHTKQRL